MFMTVWQNERVQYKPDGRGYQTECQNLEAEARHGKNRRLSFNSRSRIFSRLNLVQNIDDFSPVTHFMWTMREHVISVEDCHWKGLIVFNNKKQLRQLWTSYLSYVHKPKFPQWMRDFYCGIYPTVCAFRFPQCWQCSVQTIRVSWLNTVCHTFWKLLVVVWQKECQ